MRFFKFLFSIINILYYLVAILILTMVIVYFPYRAYTNWQRVLLTSKVSTISYILIMLFAGTTLIFDIWLFQKFSLLAQLTGWTIVLRRRIFERMIRTILFIPGIINIFYFFPLIFLKK